MEQEKESVLKGNFDQDNKTMIKVGKLKFKSSYFQNVFNVRSGSLPPKIWSLSQRVVFELFNKKVSPLGTIPSNSEF